MRLRRHATTALPGNALLLALMASAPAGTLASEWRPFGLQGTLVRSLGAGPDLLCAGTQGDGIHCRSLTSATDGWKPIGPAGATITWIWIDRTRPGTIFAAAGGISPPPGSTLLYRTFDGGATWEPADADLQRQGAGRIHAVDGGPPSPLLSPLPPPVFAGGSGVWRSNDNGLTWDPVFPDLLGLSLERPPTDFFTVWAGGETFIFSGLTILSRDLGATWETVWDSRSIGDNQTSDIAAHPQQDGLVLTGHEGFILRTEDHGKSFAEVLSAPARFFLDWDGGNPDRAWAAGSSNNPGSLAFVSRDRGLRWSDVTGTVLAPRTVFRLEADEDRLGVAYAATDDGVYRFYGGGLPVCLDTRAGDEALMIWPGPCPPILAPGPVIQGDAIAADPRLLRLGGDHVDLGEVECLIDDGDIAFVTIDPPDPAPGRALAILARRDGATDYGAGSDGLPRRPSRGDCR